MPKNGLPLHADDLRDMEPEEVRKVLGELGADKVKALRRLWAFWARPDQLEPVDKDDPRFHGDPWLAKNWFIWMALAGRGWGKTRSGAEWVRDRIKKGDPIVHAVAPTKGDVRQVMVEGDSGLLNVCHKDDKDYRGRTLGFPQWSPTNNTLTWENGAKCRFFSAEDPERLRGPQAYSAWCDELCAWNRQQETWDMLMFGLRLGKHPRVFITTTPKPTKLLRQIVKAKTTVLSTGSTFDNASNLADTFLEGIRKDYEGTRLGRQELYAEVLDEASGALWNRSILEQCELESTTEDYLNGASKDIPALQRIVVAVDPAITANQESDMTGIVVAGTCTNGKAYVIEDATGMYTPNEWAAKVVALYHKYSADRIVAERNQGGLMVRHTIETEQENLPIRLVHASRGKFARAEPVSALYEQHKVFHVKGLNDLEDQMVVWEPLGSIGSPDRLDALVWALTDLMLGGVARPKLNLGYETGKGLLGGLSLNTLG